jgi:hypothetical protein
MALRSLKAIKFVSAGSRTNRLAACATQTGITPSRKVRLPLFRILSYFPAFLSFFLCDSLFGSVLADVFRDLHTAEVRTAYAAEVRGFRAFLRESFVVELSRGFRIRRQIEFVFPTELTRLCPQPSP